MMKLDENKWYVKAYRNQPIRYTFFIAAIAGLVYLLGRGAGKNSYAEYKPKPLPEEPNWSPDIFVEEAWSVLNGFFTLASDKEEFFLKLMGMSDRQLNQIYSLYGTRYGKQDGYTLTKKIDAEWNVFLTGSRNALVKKLRTLELN